MRLAGRYLNRWTSNFRAEGALSAAVIEWRNALAGFDEDDIEAAFNYAMKQESLKTWPPTANEFRDICKAVKKSKKINVPLLPYKRPPEENEKGHANFNAIRKKFGFQ